MMPETLYTRYHGSLYVDCLDLLEMQYLLGMIHSERVRDLYNLKIPQFMINRCEVRDQRHWRSFFRTPLNVTLTCLILERG